MQNDHRGGTRKAAGLLILVFSLGIALGAVVARLIVVHAMTAAAGRPPRSSDQASLLGRLTRELNLTSDQRKQIADILANMQTKYDKIRQQEEPQYELIRSEGHERIRQVLAPKQQPKFENFLQRLQEDRRNHDNRNR